MTAVTPKVGDRVRVTYEGTVTGVDFSWFTINGAWFRHRAVPGRTVEILPPEIPAEPPVGSVVLDSDGDAWQRYDDGWRWAGLLRTWGELTGASGPVTVIHTPEGTS